MSLLSTYEHLTLSQKGPRLLVTLKRGRSNPMNLAMIQEITRVFQAAREAPQVMGAILTGQPGYFSVGLDLKELYGLDRARLETFWRSFFEMKVALLEFDKPLVAAISGHSPAGGCVLAVCSDYRLMASGSFHIGLNEVPVGIVVPQSIFQLYAFWIGTRRAYQYLLEGKLMTVHQAWEVGLVDEVLPPEELLEKADRHLKTCLANDAETWRASKRTLRRPMIEAIEHEIGQAITPLLDHWFAPSTRARLEALVQQLQKGKS